MRNLNRGLKSKSIWSMWIWPSLLQKRCKKNQAGEMLHYVYLITKAVHVELDLNLSSKIFLSVFRRFVARRGCPSAIFSDNCSNFVWNEIAAERELNEAELIRNELLATNPTSDVEHLWEVCWYFIPPKVLHHDCIIVKDQATFSPYNKKSTRNMKSWKHYSSRLKQY